MLGDLHHDPALTLFAQQIMQTPVEHDAGRSVHRHELCGLERSICCSAALIAASSSSVPMPSVVGFRRTRLGRGAGVEAASASTPRTRLVSQVDDRLEGHGRSTIDDRAHVRRYARADFRLAVPRTACACAVPRPARCCCSSGLRAKGGSRAGCAPGAPPRRCRRAW